MGWGIRSLRAAWSLWRAVRRSARVLRQDRPDVMVGMGSYACYGPCRAATKLEIPLVLHEANVIPGRAVSWLARRAVAVGVTFEETRFYLRQHAIVVTGMPLRRDLVDAAARMATTPRPRGWFTVLITGGSRGAHRINEVVIETVRLLGPRRQGIRWLHLTGVADESNVRAFYDSLGLEHRVEAFTPTIAEWYVQADLVISRAGASTCAELALFGLPALLVPYPYAARGHQLANARTVARRGAADIVEEADLECGWLAEYIEGMRRAEDRRARMREAMRRLARTDATEQLADLVERAAHDGRESRSL